MKLPPSAYANESTREIDDSWLQKADRDEQVAAISKWFHARFCDPVEETPYSDGDYIWVYGGPYDAHEEIETRFDGVVDVDVIEEAVAELQSGGIFNWAPTELTYHDDFFDADVDERNEPTQRLEQRLTGLKAVMNLSGDESVRRDAIYLVYAGVISALETFLWETMSYWVESSKDTVKRLVVGHPVFRDRTIKLGHIFEMEGRLIVDVKAHMQAMVWHRTDQVGMMFKHGLGVTIGLDRFDEAIRKRHDIVHRFGHDASGSRISINEVDVANLAESVLSFAKEVDGAISKAEKLLSSPAAGS